MVRAPSFDKNGIKKGAWSEEEDNKLRAYIHRYGHPNWRELPKFAGLSRCGKSCRLRWMNYLRPNVKRGSFTKAEEDVITSVHNKHGNKWSKMAALLPGRSDNEIKNYWHTHLKDRVRKEHQTVKKNENSQNLDEPYDAANLKRWPIENPNFINAEQEVEILLKVLSSDNLAPSSSTSTDQSSPTSLNISDYEVPCDLTPAQMSDTFGNLWMEPYLPDDGSIIRSSSDYMFSSFGVTDEAISEASLQDEIIDDLFLWST